MATKKATCIVLDVRPGMYKSIAQSGRRYIDDACEIVAEMIHSKFLTAHKTDHMQLVLVGTEETKIHIPNAGNFYQHITEHGVMEAPKLELLKFVAQQLPSMETQTTADADIFEGLIVGLDVINVHCKHLKFFKRLVLLTDGSPPCNLQDEEDVKALIKEKEIELSIVGFGPNTCAQDSNVEPDTAENVKKRLKSFISFFQSDQGSSDFFDADEAKELSSQLRKREVKPTTLSRCNLSLGDSETYKDSSLDIPIWVYAKTQEFKPPSANKVTANPLEIEGVERSYVYMVRKYETVASQAEESSEGSAGREIDPEKRIQAFKYGNILVPLSSDHIQASKPDEEKSMVILKFIPKEKIRRELYLSNVLMVVAEPKNKFAMTAMIALAEAMLTERHYVALVRYVSRSKAKPKVGILMPVMSEGLCYFYWIQVPFADDVRLYEFPPLQPLVDDPPLPINPNASGTPQRSISVQSSNSMINSGRRKKHKLDRRLVSPEQIRERFDNFIHDMNLMNAAVNPEGNDDEALKPEEVKNPVYQRMFQVLKTRALNADAPIPTPNPEILVGISPSPKILERAKPALNELREAFELKEVENKKRKNLEAIMATDFEAQPGKRVKEEEDEDYSSLSRNKKVSISKTNPVADFQTLMNYRENQTINAAIEEMQKVITLLIEQSSSFASEQEVIIESLIALRDGCKRESEYASWNGYIKSLKKRFLNPEDKAFYDKPDIWTEIQKNQLQLIRTEGEEVPSEDEMDNFSANYDKHSSAPQISVPDDDDDEMD